jgi:hypothetical protein
MFPKRLDRPVSKTAAVSAQANDRSAMSLE